MKPPKGTPLADFTRFETLIVQIDTIQIVTEMSYFTYLGGIPPPKFGNDGPGVNCYGGSNFTLIYGNCRALVTLHWSRVRAVLYVVR